MTERKPAAAAPDPDELAAMIDELMSAGSQHVNLQIGDETRVQTVNSTDCSGKPGACAVPNFDHIDQMKSEEDDD